MQAIFELRKAVQVRLGTYTPPPLHFFKKSKLACIITLIEFPSDFEIPDSIRIGVIATTPQENSQKHLSYDEQGIVYGAPSFLPSFFLHPCRHLSGNEISEESEY